MRGARRIDVLLAGEAGAAALARVWLVPLDVPDETVECLWTLLSQEERVQAARFHAEAHRRRFVVRRARRRELLASYLGCAPHAVEVEEEPGRKPRLGGGSAIEFSASHSGDLAAFAVAGRDVGVDLERVDAAVDLDGVAGSFSARERAAISVAPARQRLRRFFDCWTCKEAYVKAMGTGLATPLDSFDVSEALGRERTAHVEAFGVRLLRAPPRHALALALRVPGDN